MSLIRFNLVKVERGLLYQPLWFDASLYDRIQLIDTYIHASQNTDKYFKFYPHGSVSLHSDSIHMGLNPNSIRSGDFKTKTFVSNSDRDKYYDKILHNIEFVMKYIKEYRR